MQRHPGHPQACSCACDVAVLVTQRELTTRGLLDLGKRRGLVGNEPFVVGTVNAEWETPSPAAASSAYSATTRGTSSVRVESGGIVIMRSMRRRTATCHERRRCVSLHGRQVLKQFADSR